MNRVLLIILLLSSLTRIWGIDYPSNYVFDEVYHGFTAKEYAKGSKEAWEWWTKPPPNVAYEWTHPPLAKELMATSLFITHSQEPWAYRLPGAILGIISVYFVYLIGRKLFGHEDVALISAFIFSLDGLNFVQSRVGMNDIYFVTFMIISLFFFLKDRHFISGLFFGLSVSSKWSAIYLLGVYFILYILQYRLYKSIFQLKRILIFLFSFIFIPLFVYLFSYLPFFLLGHGWKTFIELNQQMWWYHTNLRATHDYTSPWWSWPLNLYPVWYFVEYHKNGTVSNIFASGNPVMLWLGAGALILTIWDFVKTKSKALLIIFLGYLAFLLPWALSPRIMFLYHYSPSIPFLSLALGYQISQFKNQNNYRLVLGAVLGFVTLGFLLIYPMLVGTPIDKNLLQLFFRTNLTKNPF